MLALDVGPVCNIYCRGAAAWQPPVILSARGESLSTTRKTVVTPVLAADTVMNEE